MSPKMSPIFGLYFDQRTPNEDNTITYLPTIEPGGLTPKLSS